MCKTYIQFRNHSFSNLTPWKHKQSYCAKNSQHITSFPENLAFLALIREKKPWLFASISNKITQIIVQSLKLSKHIDKLFKVQGFSYLEFQSLSFSNNIIRITKNQKNKIQGAAGMPLDVLLQILASLCYSSDFSPSSMLEIATQSSSK